MYSIGAFLGTFVIQLPVLAVLVIGLVLLLNSGRRLPGRSALLAKAGLIVLLVGAAGSMIWSAALPYLVNSLNNGDNFVRTFGFANAGVGLLLSVVTATGLGLLIGALLSARSPAPPYYPAPPADSYSAPSPPSDHG